MDSNAYFIPAVSHITSHTHLLSLIYDEMNEAMLGMTNGNIGITTQVTIEDVYAAVKSAGLVGRRLPEVNNAIAMKTWRRVAFLVACAGMFPTNSRAQISIASGPDWIDVQFSERSVSRVDIDATIPKNESEARTLVENLCGNFGGERDNVGWVAIKMIGDIVSSHAHKDHRMFSNWPPTVSFVDQAVGIMAKRNIPFNPLIITDGVYGKLKRAREGK